MNIKQTLSNFNELVMMKHSIFSLPFIFIAIFVENGSLTIGWRLFALAIVATMSARNFAMGFNRLVDAKYDILNPRTASRPSVDGRITSSKLIIFLIVNIAIFILAAYFVNHTAFLISTPVLVFLALYSYIKRFSSLAHIYLGATLALAPLAGIVAVSGSIHLWGIYLSIGVLFWVAGFDLLYSLQDIEFDKQNNLHSIPAKFGTRKTLIFSRIFHILTTIFWILFVLQSDLGLFAIIGLMLSGIILGYEHILVRQSLTNINRAFFTLNGYLGIIFLIFVCVDIVG